MTGVDSINHTAMCVHDLVEALDFYCNVLGARPNQRSNFQIEDAQSGVPLFQSVIIEDYLLALAVSADYMPVPPDAQLRGAHGFRHGFVVRRKRFDDVLGALRRRGVPFEGPVDHPNRGPFGQSIYFKDPSGNFLEVVWRRDEPETARARRYVSAE